MPRERRTFPTRELAERAEIHLKSNALKRAVGLPVEVNITIRMLVDKHLMEVQHRRARMKPIETILNRFAKLIGEGVKIEGITRAHLHLYAKARLEKGILPQSINREFHEITSCLNSSPLYYTYLRDYKSPSPPYQEEPDKKKGRLWTAEEIEKVVAVLLEPRRFREQDWKVRTRQAVADMFLVALNTGMRIGEVRCLKKSDVDFNREIITVSSSKGRKGNTRGKVRHVPINDEAKEILRRRSKDIASPFIFPGRDGTAPLTAPHITFGSACKAAGITYGDGDGGILLTHARRTFENDLINSGERLDTIGELMGHSIQTMLKHYAQVSEEQKVKAVKNLSIRRRFLDTKKKKPAKVAKAEEKEKQQKSQ